MLIDSHCHIPHKKYKKGAAQLISESKTAGIQKLIIIGTDLKNNEDVLKVANEYEDVFACLGIYPHEHRNNDLPTLINKLETQLKSSPKVVGIGECGLDITNWEKQRPVKKQIELFEMQIELAQKLSLPTVIHNRNGNEYLLDIWKNAGNPKGILHCFASGWEFAKKALDQNLYLSFSGIVTYPTAGEILEAVKNVPNNKFLLETDAPYLSPQSVRGQVCEPKYVKMTAQKVAEVKQIPVEQVEELSYKNTCDFFAICD